MEDRGDYVFVESSGALREGWASAEDGRELLTATRGTGPIFVARAGAPVGTLLCSRYFGLLGGRMLSSQSLQQMRTPVRLADAAANVAPGAA